MSTFAYMDPGKRTSPGHAFPLRVRVGTTATRRNSGSRMMIFSSNPVAASVVADLKAEVGNTTLGHSQPQMRTVMKEQRGALKTTESLLWRQRRDAGSLDRFPW